MAVNVANKDYVDINTVEKGDIVYDRQTKKSVIVKEISKTDSKIKGRTEVSPNVYDDKKEFEDIDLTSEDPNDVLGLVVVG